MDPDANLREQLELAAAITARAETIETMRAATLTSENVADLIGAEIAQELAADSLAERVVALDEWLRRGGFLPAAWRQQPTNYAMTVDE